MQEVVKNLFIGDYAASQDAAALEEKGIKAVIAAMRQTYPCLPGISLLRIEIDDAATNIIAHFPASNSFIREALARGEAVLVHCQAGVSRSTTLVAAFLMAELELEVEQAVEMVRSVRGQVEPTEFFLAQLEMYERCNCEWDPVRYNEQRRFLMGFAQAQIMDGTSPSIVLAYYPSPSPSPRDRSSSDPFSLKMTPIDADQLSESIARKASLSRDSPPDPPSSAENGEPKGLGFEPARSESVGPPTGTPMRKRLTARGAGKQPEKVKEKTLEKAKVEKIGQKGQVVITGKRIRCKMCRRELAAREHILVHEPGMGQQAFAPHRRDMAAHRAEQERRRMDEIDREKQQRPAPSTTGAAPPSLAGLRIAQPPTAVPGLRMAVPRPRQATAEIPVATLPDPLDPETISSDPPTDSPSKDSTVEQTLELPTAESEVAKEEEEAEEEEAPPPEPPLLPSHLCSSYFTEPLSWMSATLESGSLAGKIICANTKCGAKLGSYDWAGLQCSCGAWVCPGFALNVSKVDEVTGTAGR